MRGLDQVRDVFDRNTIGLILIGMPGLEKRLARYAQFYSRIGFVHEFHALNVAEVRQLLDESWMPEGVTLPSLAVAPNRNSVTSTGTEYTCAVADQTPARR